jgi:hypothetical protein
MPRLVLEPLIGHLLEEFQKRNHSSFRSMRCRSAVAGMRVAKALVSFSWWTWWARSFKVVDLKACMRGLFQPS